jgi:hypothetical protein
MTLMLTQPNAAAKGDHPPLRPVQRRAVQLLALGKRNVDVAREIGLRDETISRWKHLPNFAAALEAAMQEFEQEASELLRQGLPKAIVNAERLMSCRVESVELGASKFFLEGYAGLIKQRDQQKEIDALKEQVLNLITRLDGESAT